MNRDVLLLKQCGLENPRDCGLTIGEIQKIKKEAFDNLFKIEEFLIDDGAKGFEKARQYNVGKATFDSLDEIFRNDD